MIVKEDFWYDPEQEYRTLHVYLPDEYDNTDERYPVMYFFDGHNLFLDEDTTYGKSWGLKDFLDHWDKKIIIVGVECSHRGRHRLSEYCPYVSDAFDAHLEGLGKQTMDWFVNVLKPYIDKELRTYPFRECTAIGGSSMGGLMALYAGIAYNHIYSKCACISPSAGIVKKELLEELSNNYLDPDTRFFISWGEYESKTKSNPEYFGWAARNNRAIEKELRKRGVITRIYYQAGGGHCEADWEKENPYYMGFLWKDE